MNAKSMIDTVNWWWNLSSKNGGRNYSVQVHEVDGAFVCVRWRVMSVSRQESETSHSDVHSAVSAAHAIVAELESKGYVMSADSAPRSPAIPARLAPPERVATAIPIEVPVHMTLPLTIPPVLFL